jgi:hypothetical protein
MALIHPAGWREMASTGNALREIATLNLLAQRLPDDYSVYHGVHWTNVDHGYSAYGEIDFIIVAPDGRLLLIEQKSGFLEETADGLIKKSLGKSHMIHVEITRTIRSLMARFGKNGGQLDIDYLLYCPDYHVKHPQRAGIEAARIIDAGNSLDLARRILVLLPPLEAAAQRKKVERFLGDTLQLSADPSAMIGQARQLVTRLSGGLATWARQLEFRPFRLRVIGTAGSGKTQLALAEYRAAIDAGKQPLYVCYNRPLADHVQQLVPPGGRVASFHLLCDSFSREKGRLPDYTQAGMWQLLEQAFADGAIPESWKFDVLIIDEGQDFSAAWRDSLLRLLKPDGRAIWLEDPLQNLYGKAPVPLEGWVTLHSDVNFRSPRHIIELLMAMAPPMRAIEAASPFHGADVELLRYPEGDIARMQYQTKHAITLCLGAGFTRADMALVSFHGRDKSALLKLDALGTHSLRSFTGEYDLLGKPVFRDGELLAESVYRFKGQSAPAVIFTEIDFAELDERHFRKLFVGMTRARLKLILVLSEPAAAILVSKSQSHAPE